MIDEPLRASPGFEPIDRAILFLGHEHPHPGNPKVLFLPGAAARYNFLLRAGAKRKQPAPRDLSSMRFLALLVFGIACGPPVLAKGPLQLADPVAPIDKSWTHQRFGVATEYTRVTRDGVPAIRAVGRTSASGLYRDVRYNVVEHPWLAWTWRVDRLQRTADIRTKAREDYAAAIFVIFGRPSMANRNVPTLAYVWTNELLPEDTIADSPHHPGTIRSIVVRSGVVRLGQWSRERRNVVDDFRRAFGRDPPSMVEVIALFTDNDQTGEPVEAYYGAIRALAE